MATFPLIHHSTPSDRRLENIALWVLQWTLCALLLGVGISKFALSHEDMRAIMPWSAAVPLWFVRFIAIMEITGAVGLVVPAWLRVVPEATPWAACGIVGMQWLALAFHLGRQEWFMTPVNIVLGIAAGIVAWGRFNYLPIKEMKQPVSENIDKPGAIPPGMA
jgi:putative oxidoreductase